MNHVSTFLGEELEGFFVAQGHRNLLKVKHEQGIVKSGEPFKYARELTEIAKRKGYVKRRVVDSPNAVQMRLPPLDATSSSSDNETTPPPPKKRKRTHTTTSVEGQNGTTSVEGQNGTTSVEGQNGKTSVEGQNGKTSVEGQNGKKEDSQTEDIQKMNHVEVHSEVKNNNRNGNTQHVSEDDITESLPDLTSEKSSEMNQEKNNTHEMDSQVNAEEKVVAKNETDTKNGIKLEKPNIKSEKKTDLQSESKVRIEREVKTEVKTEVKAELKTEVKHDVDLTQNGDGNNKKEVKHVSSENGDGNNSPKENVIEMNHDGDCETTLDYSADGMKHEMIVMVTQQWITFMMLKNRYRNKT